MYLFYKENKFAHVYNLFMFDVRFSYLQFELVQILSENKIASIVHGDY